MRHHLQTALRLALVSLLLTGVGYPMLILGLTQLLFPRQANGSLIRDGNRVLGSRLLGQPCSAPGSFHPRPSAAGGGYDALASGGSNLGPTSRALHDRVAREVAHLRHGTPGLRRVPVDMVTTSGSGLDPDVTPATAYAQVPRVARERGLTEQDVRELVDRATIPRQLGFLGEPRVNVVHLNGLLDRFATASSP